MMTRCVRPRAGAFWPLALPLIPYMRANLRRKRKTLARGGAVIAVGSAIARDLRERAAELADTFIATIPNSVDVRALQAETQAQKKPIDQPYMLYAGKLDLNKGVSQLMPVVTAAGLDVPLVVFGDGPERSRFEAAARESGLDVGFKGWAPPGTKRTWSASPSSGVQRTRSGHRGDAPRRRAVAARRGR